MEKVLVIDDDVDVARIVEDVLVDRGYQATVINRTDRYGKAIRDRVAHESPQLILLDLMMPDIDGFQVLELLQSDPRTAEIPVIVFTAATQSIGDLREYYGASIADFVAKPFDIDALLDKISHALQMAPRQDGTELSAGL